MKKRLLVIIAFVLPMLSIGQVQLADHANFQAKLGDNGFTVNANHGDNWTWQLVYFGAASENLFESTNCPTAIGSSQEALMAFDLFTEKYISRTTSIEQQFIIPEPLPINGDLIIEGSILADAEFIEKENGWAWVSEDGDITLGDVTVFDANGKTIPAVMNVSQNGSRIVIDGNALALATYPVTVDPEIGANDFLISSQGTVGVDTIDAVTPSIAYNATDDEYAVVWSGDSIFGHEEIFIQLIDASTGNLSGSAKQVSHMSDSSVFDCFEPQVAWNSQNNEYLVIWKADSAINGEDEIWGQRMSNTLAHLGTPDFRISTQGPTGNASFKADDPKVAYNSTANEYLVVWSGDTIAGEDEIYAQRINGATGVLIGMNTRITWHGAPGATNVDALNPDVAYNNVDDEYMVVWSGDDVPGEDEIFVQRLNGSDIALIGNPVQITDIGFPGSTLIDAVTPEIAFNPQANQYLVVFMSDNDTLGLVNGESEIWGQVISNTGADVGADDFRISTSGPDGDGTYDAYDPEVVYSPVCAQYIVVWESDDSTAALVNGESEIHLQVFNSNGTMVGSDSLVSDIGGYGTTALNAFNPAIAYNSTAGEFLIVFEADDTLNGYVDNEFEIYGQRWGCANACIPPQFTMNPVDDTICPGDNSLFSIDGTGAMDSMRWQVSTDGGSTWTDLSDGGSYSNTTQDTMNITGAPGGWSGYMYRALAYGCGGLSDSSNAGTLLIDIVDPVITCPADTTVTPSTLDCDPAVNFNAATATDNCLGAAVTYSHNPGDEFMAGQTTVMAYATDSSGNMDSCSFMITVNAPMLTNWITVNGDSLCSSPAATYQWFFNGVQIGGATGQCHYPQLAGNYHVEVSDTSGCQAVSDTLFHDPTSIGDLLGASITIYPNPVRDDLMIKWDNPPQGMISLQLVDATGRIIQQAEQNAAKLGSYRMSMSEIPAGTYMLKISTSNGTAVKAVLKQ